MGPGDLGAPPEEGAETPYHPDSVEARGPLTSERLTRRQRLTGAQDIRRIVTRGRRYRAVYLEILWDVNQAGYPRLGLIVPKYQSNAVARNRLRRRLKEIWRRAVLPRLAAVDVVVRTRRESYAASWAGLEAEVLGWLKAKAPVGSSGGV